MKAIDRSLCSPNLILIENPWDVTHQCIRWHQIAPQTVQVLSDTLDPGLERVHSGQHQASHQENAQILSGEHVGGINTTEPYSDASYLVISILNLDFPVLMILVSSDYCCHLALNKFVNESWFSNILNGKIKVLKKIYTMYISNNFPFEYFINQNPMRDLSVPLIYLSSVKHQQCSAGFLIL